MGALGVAVVIEEVARHDGSLALTVASHNGLGTGHILRFGTEAQKQRYLPTLARGREARRLGAHRARERLRRRRPAHDRRPPRRSAGS